MSDPMIGRVLAGRFRIESKLGEGGMGAVYLAEHTLMKRQCALKILPTQLRDDRQALARFYREAQLSSKIAHPHAVTIYDFGEAEDGVIYLAMEYIEGETLAALLKRERQLDARRAIGIIRQAGEALAAAHQLGIVHRDLKPENIMLARDQWKDVVKVLDFGIAKTTAGEPRTSELTQTGFVVGTPYYMSPEQVKGEQLDERSDLYSLALILYEMLTGERAFAGENSQAVMVKRVLESPRALEEVNPGVAPQVASVVMRALASRREERQSGVSAFLAQLLGAATDAGIVEDGSARATTPVPEPEEKPTISAADTTTTLVGQISGGSPVAAPTQGLTLHELATEVASRVPLSADPASEKPPSDYLTRRMDARANESTPHLSAPAVPPTEAVSNTIASLHEPRLSAGARWFVIGGGVAVILLAGIAAAWYFNSSRTASVTPASESPGAVNGSSAASKAEAYYHEAIKMFEARDFQGAGAVFRMAIEIQPDFPKAHENLGVTLLAIRQPAEALSELKIAEKQYSAKPAGLYYSIGLAHYDLGEYAEASNAFEQALTIDPSDNDLILYRAFALQNSGKTAEARAVYRSFLETDPPSDQAENVKLIMAGKAIPPKHSPYYTEE